MSERRRRRPDRAAPQLRATGGSGTPLARKLGIGAGSVVHLVAAPAAYRALLAPLPPDVRFAAAADAATDIVHVFATWRADFAPTLAALRRTLRADAALWVSWPKQAARVPTDVTEDVIRAVALPLGLVDIKVCAVTDVWSGLKLVVRRELR
jgi:hypothetical protein